MPFGKHPLENRLKWKGITARPREEGHYRGLLPVMEEILRGKRNDSILRFVRTSACRACGGTRLKREPLAVLWQGRSIAALAALTARELHGVLSRIAEPGPVLSPIRADLLARCALMDELGVGYLSFDRAAPTLSPGEACRLRLLTLALGELRGLVVVLEVRLEGRTIADALVDLGLGYLPLGQSATTLSGGEAQRVKLATELAKTTAEALVVLHEPSSGLHAADVATLLSAFERLCTSGHTLLVADHDLGLVRAADWIVELGPEGGERGGRIVRTGAPVPAVGPGLPIPRTGEPP